jgi:formimidoylglutamate deiminase
MADLYFQKAFLDGAWATDVRIALTPDGDFDSVVSGADPEDADHIGGVAVPGVPNLHSHAFQRALAGLTERGSERGDTFWSWRERMYRFLRRLGPEDVEAIAAQLYSELLRHGYTAVSEFHYLRNDPAGHSYEDPVELGRRLLSAGRRAGIGMTILPVLYRTGGFGGAPPSPEQARFLASVDELLTDVRTLAASADGHDNRVGLGLHSLRAVPPDDMTAAVWSMTELDSSAPIHIHAAEQLGEVEACMAWSGARPIEWLLANAGVDSRWCVVHATHMIDAEVAGLAGSGAVAGLCPTTEANLGDGLFRFRDYATRGGIWGVGTDSHVSVSPVADLRLLEYGQRLVRRERNVAAGASDRSTGRTLLEAAWSGGAQACGRKLGRISRGARADLVVLDPDHPALVGRDGDDLLDSWVFSGEDSPVRDVMVGGQWVVRDGRHAREEQISRAYRAAMKRISA